MPDSLKNDQQLNGRKLTILSILSGFVWLLLGNLIILYIQDKSLGVIVRQGDSFLLQVGMGLLTGASIGLLSIGLMKLPSFYKILDEYAIIRQVKELSISPLQIVYVSLIAGITEEILFRGAIQPVTGIWWTSLIFIGIHGYLRFQSIPQFVYSLFTYSLSAVLGLLFIYFGLISAIAAHFIYDVVVIYGIKQISVVPSVDEE